MILLHTGPSFLIPSPINLTLNLYVLNKVKSAAGGGVGSQRRQTLDSDSDLRRASYCYQG